MGEVVCLGRMTWRPYPGWRIRVDTDGIAHHEPIPAKPEREFTLVPDGFDMRPGAINWIYQ